MCLVCGIKAEKACGACHVARYCSKAHQRLHWTQGEHKQQCPLVAKVEKDSEENVPALTTPAGEDRMSKILFHLSEIVSEPEPERKEGRDDEDGYNAGEVELLQRMRVSESKSFISGRVAPGLRNGIYRSFYSLTSLSLPSGWFDLISFPFSHDTRSSYGRCRRGCRGFSS